MKRWIIFILVVLVGSTLWAGDKIRIVATIPDLGWAAKEIGGDAVEVQSFMQGNEDPHYLDAVPKFVLWSSKADMVCFAGLDLEIGWLPKVLEQSGNARVQPGGNGYCEVGKFIDVLEKIDGPVDRSMGDIHPRGNPHFWLSPKRLAQGARGIAETLAALRPDKADYFFQNLERFQTKMDALSKSNQQQLRNAPMFIEYHKAFVYWANDMGVRSFGAIEEKPGVPPSAGHLAKIALKAKAAHVHVALAASFNPKSTLDRFSEFSGIPVEIVPACIQKGSSYEAVQKRLIDAVFIGHP